MLGSAQEFKKKFENAILRGRDADATKEQQERGEAMLAELSSVVNKCIIRRTSTLLTKYLPVCNISACAYGATRAFQIKYELIVCCKLTELQETIYRKVIKGKSKELSTEERERNKASGISGTALSFITNLKKLCNHPQLIYDKCVNREPGFQGELA